MPSLADIPHYQSLFDLADSAGSPPSLDTFDHLRAYRELGPIYQVRFRGEDWVCVGGLEANETAWRNPDAWSYHDALASFREMMGPTHLTQLDGPAHREKRKVLKPGFAASTMGPLLPAIDQTVSDLFHQHAGEQLNLHDFFMEVLTEANSRSTVITPLAPETRRALIQFEEQFILGIGKDKAARDAWWGRPEFLELRRQALGFCESIVRQRLAGHRENDGLQAVLDGRIDDGSEPDVEALVSECYLLLIAGTGNTAKVLNCGLRHLLAQPDWYAQLQAEVKDYAVGALASGMSAFPKLKATLMEMERLFPAAPVLSRVSTEPLEFYGVTLPAGTKVLHLHTITHFLEEIYEEPYAFKPQRWLENKYPRKAHGTFGGSTHVCLGMNLARVHMPIIVANLLRDFALQLDALPEIKVDFNFGVPQTAYLHARLVSAA